MKILEVDNLKTWVIQESSMVRAVDGISFAIAKGETFALLGESGCGKSMTALSILRLLPPSGKIVSGQIRLNGEDILALPESGMRQIRGGKIAIIFQEPALSLNPVLTIAEQIEESLKRHGSLPKNELKEKTIALLSQVGIADPKSRLQDYPFQLSGGMKQRVMIAMALAGEPDLLIADEPTTALDVTIQAQILDLLRKQQEKLNMGLLLITHDLGVVSEMAHQVAVMYAGEIVEMASREAFFENPAHPYSQKLFASVPTKDKKNRKLEAISGSVPPLNQKFGGCRFADRCEYAHERCRVESPGWSEYRSSLVRCHLYPEGNPPTARAETVGGSSSGNKDAGSLLEVSGLKVYFPVRKGILRKKTGEIRAVDGVSFSVAAGKTLALVGESGCGKTTTGKALLQLINPTSGSVKYGGAELVGLKKKALLEKRRGMQIVFQDPYASLNPKMRIGEIIEEPMGSEKGGLDRLLEQVGLPRSAQDRYPHEFSGGQRQRIAIARALAVNPKLLICDEPTSALDVSVQAQILNLLRKLQEDLSISYLFITHNISVVEYLAHDVAVMYMGKIVEKGSVEQVLNDPAHPYTRALLASVPKIGAKERKPVESGELTDSVPSGCHFRKRCPHAMPICEAKYPDPSFPGDGREVGCHLYGN